MVRVGRPFLDAATALRVEFVVTAVDAARDIDRRAAAAITVANDCGSSA